MRRAGRRFDPFLSPRWAPAERTLLSFARRSPRGPGGSMTIKKTENPFAGLESGVSGAILGAGRGAKAVVDSVAGVLTGALKGSSGAHSSLLGEARALADSAVR